MMTANLGFPGIPATLDVNPETLKERLELNQRLETQNPNRFKKDESLQHLTNIWTFYSITDDRMPLIDRVEVWENKSGISLVNIFYNHSYCESVKDDLEKTLSSKNLVYKHYLNSTYCLIQATEREDINLVLSLLNSSQNFTEKGKSEMEKIINTQ